MSYTKKLLKKANQLSVGNDVIDLSEVDHERTNQLRFYSKIISPIELEFYNNIEELSAIPLSIFVWMCWSIKESAYKYIKRLQPEILFAPLKFKITHFSLSNNNQFLSIVNFQSNVVNCATTFNTDFILTHTYLQQIADTSIQIFDNTKGEYGNVKEWFLKNQSTQNVDIIKHKVGYPEFFVNEVNSQMILSFSDHGKYLSYAFLVN